MKTVWKGYRQWEWLPKLDFSIIKVLTEVFFSRAHFNHTAKRGFVSLSGCLLMRRRGEGLQGNSSHINSPGKKSNQSDTGPEGTSSTIKNKEECLREQAPSWDRYWKRKWPWIGRGRRSDTICLICLIWFWRGSKDVLYAASSKLDAKEPFEKPSKWSHYFHPGTRRIALRQYSWTIHLSSSPQAVPCKHLNNTKATQGKLQ